MREPPEVCPRCGEKDTLEVTGDFLHCTDPNCGQSFPIAGRNLNRVPGTRTRKWRKAEKNEKG
jgi:hypothetical protein